MELFGSSGQWLYQDAAASWSFARFVVSRHTRRVEKAMSDDHSTITLPPDALTVIVDAIQRAIVDKGASKATRKAAFSALLALVDAGLIVGVTSTNSPANDATGVAQAHAGARSILAGHHHG
jgi:hypothetical protein